MKHWLLQARSGAKINLSLDVLGRRADGFHELESITQTVGWWDHIEIEVHQTTDEASVKLWCDRSDLNGESNLAARAAKAWLAATGHRLHIAIGLHKNVPSGAGLGGGSANAAAVLQALQSLSEPAESGASARCHLAPLAPEALLEVAVSLGADVPLFLRGGAQWMGGIGEVLRPLPSLCGHALIVKPHLSLATGPVFAALARIDQASPGRASRDLLDLWRHTDGAPSAEQVMRRSGNDLEAAVDRLCAIPARLRALLRASARAGDENSTPAVARMSGSGSACFALFDSEAAARQAADRLGARLRARRELAGSLVRVVPLCETGVQWRAINTP